MSASAVPPVETETVASVDEHLDRLLTFEATTFPVISLYLNTQADDRGRDRFQQFVRKELSLRARTFPAGSAERQSFDQDAERIQKWLDEAVIPAANGVAIFACFAADLWETVQLTAPVDENRLYVYNQPHLYHLARLDDEYPRHAALITDANWARIFVFGLGQTLQAEEVKGKKVQRVKVGGWSQARYQRRVQNAHSDHAKEVIAALERVVRSESIQHVVLAGDPQILPVLQEQMTKELADKLVDAVRLDINASDKQVFEASLEALRKQDAETDAEKVQRLVAEYRRGGLAVVGPQDTLEALANGQVDELLVSASLEQVHPEETQIDAVLAPEIPDSAGGTESDEPRAVLLPDLLVTKAKQTDARISFIQEAALLESIEGVGAFLRWRV